MKFDNIKLYLYIKNKATELFLTGIENPNNEEYKSSRYKAYQLACELSYTSPNFDEIYEGIREEQTHSFYINMQDFPAAVDFYIHLLRLVDFAALYHNIYKINKNEDDSFDKTLIEFEKLPVRTTTKC